MSLTTTKIYYNNKINHFVETKARKINLWKNIIDKSCCVNWYKDPDFYVSQIILFVII